LQTAYKFKLQPNTKQVELLEDLQHKVGYVQNRSLGDRIATYSNTFVQGDYCDLYSGREVCSAYLGLAEELYNPYLTRVYNGFLPNMCKAVRLM